MPRTDPEMDAVVKPGWGARHPDIWRVGLLLLLALALHAWMVFHAEGPARDGVGFIRYALQLDRQPWAEVMAGSHQHPLYPLTVLGVSLPVRTWMGGTSCASMVLSAQLAAALPGILLVVPMYFLGRRLFDRRVGFWAATLFQCLPVSAHVTADTLSDPLCLFFVAAALCFGVKALSSGAARDFAGSGLCGGLAYLTRPEGLIAVAAVGLVLLGMQATAAWRRPWRRFGLCAASLALAAGAVGGPFVAVTGHLSTKPTPQSILGRAASAPSGRAEGGVSNPSSDGARPLLAVYWAGAEGEPGPSLAWGLGALAREWVRAFQYLGWLPALVGLWWFRGRFRSQPGFWALLVLCVLHSLVLVLMSLVVDYLSERHVQVLVLCGSFWAVAAVAAAGEMLSRRGGGVGMPAPSAWAVPLLLAFTGFGLPVLFKPLHATHGGYRQAGLWLAAHARPGDPIIDSHNCAYFYANRVFFEGQYIPPTPDPVYYVVVRSPDRGQVLPQLSQYVDAVVRQGNVVFRCPLKGSRGRRQEVLVYAGRWPAPILSPPTSQR
jgi:hypothetical protein